MVLSVGVAAVAGETEADRKVEAAFREAFKDNPDVLVIAAKESILQFVVSEKFARAVLADKLSAQSLVTSIIESFQKLSGHKAVTFWCYWKNVKVIEASVTMTGDIEFTFSDD